MRKLAALILIAVVGMSLVVCGGGAGNARARTEVGVLLKEWSVTPSIEEARAGTVVFQVRNEGSAPHQLVVIKSDLPPEQLPVTNGTIAATQVRVLESMDPIGPGATGEVRFDATPGKFVLLCNVPGHYQQGMAAAFLVEP